MRRTLLGTCVVLGIALGAGQSARATSTRFAERGDLALLPVEPATPSITAVAEERHVRFFGRLCPLEERFFADAADGRLDEFSLLDAALIASGIMNIVAAKFSDIWCAAVVAASRVPTRIEMAEKSPASAVIVTAIGMPSATSSFNTGGRIGAKWAKILSGR